MAARAKEPQRPGWAPAGWFGNAQVWVHAGGIRVLSEIVDLEIDGMGIVTPQWLVSVSTAHNRRPTNSEMLMVRRHFGMEEAEEDNHEPGRARKLFLIVDQELRAKHAECACKVNEVQHVEPDGYRWSEVRR